MNPRACASILLAAALLAASPVIAQTPSPDAATELFKKGNDAYKKKQWAEAEQAFKEAWALKQSYDIAGNLGDVELFLGKHREAAEHLEYSLRNWPAGQEAAKKRTAERFAEAKKGVGTLSLKVSEGAEITVNGKSVGKSPLPGPVFVDAGAATIEAKIGDKSAKKTIAMDVGESRELEIVIAGEAAPVGGGDPNGSPKGDGGKASDGGQGDTGGGTPGGGGKSSGAFKTVGMIASGAVALVGLGVGVGFYMAKQSAKDDADGFKKDAVDQFGVGGCPRSNKTGVCADLVDANDRAARSRTISTIGFVGAGVGTAAFVAFVLMPSRNRSTTVVPLVDRHAAGFGAAGTF